MPLRWGLAQARAAAAGVLASRDAKKEVKRLLRELSGGDAELRQHAADTARRLIEGRAGLALLMPFAARLLDLAATALAEGVAEDWRTRGHMMLVAARVAQTAVQRRRCAELLLASVNDPRGVLRANALEGLGIVTVSQPDLRVTVEPILLHALRTGSAAERVRARDALAVISELRRG